MTLNMSVGREEGARAEGQVAETIWAPGGFPGSWLTPPDLSFEP